RHHVRERDKVRESHSAKKSQCGEEYERNREPPGARWDEGPDESPELKHDVRQCDDNADDHGYLNVETKCFAGLGVNKVRAGWQRAAGRSQNEVDDPIDERESNEHAQA